MLLGIISFVPGEAVARKFAVQAPHYSIAVNFSNDRSSRDRKDFAIAIDDCFLIQLPTFYFQIRNNKSPINKYGHFPRSQSLSNVQFRTQILYRSPHREQARLMNIYSIYFLAP